jgi:RNA polymerase sigma factor (sigma-70 family)
LFERRHCIIEGENEPGRKLCFLLNLTRGCTMTTRVAHSRWQSLDTLFNAGALGTMSDPDLLNCFSSDRGSRGQEAFRILVERHGPMVLGLCRSLIPDSHEAEDAFQATFLVLVRKGQGIWVRDSIGPWLYGVASRVARRARRRSIERRRLVVAIAHDVADAHTHTPCALAHSRETDRVIHEEVAGLPASLREPIVLCDLQGLTYEAAARNVGVPEPTLRGRLRRARQRLESRLRERGIASAAPAMHSPSGIESFVPATPVLPPLLVKSTIHHAVWWSSMAGLIGERAGVPASIAALAQGVLRSMFLSTCRVPGIVALLAAGAVVSLVIAERGAPQTLAAASRRETARAGRSTGGPVQAEPAQPARSGSRVIQGRLTDSQGRPVRGGKIMFGAQTRLMPFEESTTAVSDADGKFRIELSAFQYGSEPLPATGPLRYLALASGFHSEVGKVDEGSGPATLDLRLADEEWASTEFRLVDRDGRGVAGAELTLQLGGAFTWSKETSDAEGRCTVKVPPGQGLSISVRRDGFLTTRVGTRGGADEPASFTVPLFAPIEGRVVDLAGKPLPGIQVGRLIAPNYAAGLDKPSDHLEVLPVGGTSRPAVTDSDGRFRLEPRINLDNRSGKFRVWPMAVCLADAELRRVAFLRVDPEAARTPFEITLSPARHVRIPIQHEVTVPAGSLETWWELNDVSAGAKPQELFVMQGIVPRNAPDQASFPGDWIEAYWPVGKYRVQVNSAHTEPRDGAEQTSAEIVVPPGDGPLVLPAIRMKLLPHKSMAGKPALEIDAKDLNSGAPVRLADHKDKIVVLDFWGYWCGPCIGAMPALVESFEHFKGKPVAFIALHDQSIQSREEYDRRLSEVKRLAWNNRELPFQVALDRPSSDVPSGETGIGQGVTCKRYQIEMFPTTLVIDQDGKVVGTVEVREKGRLDAMINELLAKMPKK